MNNIQKIECLDTAIHQLLTKSPEFTEEGTTGYNLLEGLYQIKIDILKNEYPVQDGTWPSRRWSNDLSDYIDLSGFSVNDLLL